MNRLALTATIGAVLVAAILGLIYAVSIQDRDDEPTAQSQFMEALAEQESEGKLTKYVRELVKRGCENGDEQG